MSKEIQRLIIQALGQTTKDGELNYEKFKAATQDLLVDYLPERKFYSRIADEKFWTLCKRAETEDYNEALTAANIASEYLQSEYGVAKKRADEMSRYTVEAIFGVKNLQLERECDAIEKARREAEEKARREAEEKERKEADLNTNRTAGEDIDRQIEAGNGNSDLRLPKKNSKGLFLTLILVMIISVIGLIVSQQNSNDDGYSSVEKNDSEEAEEQDKDEAYNPGSYDDYEEDFIIPGSDERYIYDEEIAELSVKDTQMAIKEIYARHGCIFKDEPYASHFDSCEWYEPTYTADEFEESWFNDYEKDNIKVLKVHREGNADDESGDEEDFKKHSVESEKEAVEYGKEYYESNGGELTDNLIVTLDYEDNDGYAIRGYNDCEGYTSDVFKWRVTVDGNIYDRATEEWLLYR